jgi:hypothetical protein
MMLMNIMPSFIPQQGMCRANSNGNPHTKIWSRAAAKESLWQGIST